MLVISVKFNRSNNSFKGYTREFWNCHREQNFQTNYISKIPFASLIYSLFVIIIRKRVPTLLRKRKFSK